MKKLLSILLAIAMLTVMLAGCSGGAQSSSAAQKSSAAPASAGAEEELTGTLKLWTHQNESWDAAYEADIARFTELHPGVTIEMESFPYACSSFVATACLPWAFPRRKLLSRAKGILRGRCNGYAMKTAAGTQRLFCASRKSD